MGTLDRDQRVRAVGLDLAERLRKGQSVELNSRPAPQVDEVDVVLALEWKPLWDLSDAVLPLAFGSFKGTAEEATATLLLNYLTRTTLGLEAAYLNDSLTALAITDRTVLQLLESEFQEAVDLLRPTGREPLSNAYARLAAIMGEVSPRALRKAHHSYTKRLDLPRIRSRHTGELVPGLTTHQAKGGERDRVGLCLKPKERDALTAGLDQNEDVHRKLSVAYTRAHYETALVI